MDNQLTVVERAFLEKLISPGEQEKVKYAWDDDFQRVLIGMMLSDRFFLCQSLGLVKPTYFSNEVHQLACRLVLEYFHEYRQMPSKIFMRQVMTDTLREKHQSQDNETFQGIKLSYIAELNTVYDYFARGGIGDMMPGLDSVDAILDKVSAFAKTQAMKFAFHKSLELIRKSPESDETWAKVDDILRKARLVERKIDLGLDYFGTVEMRYARMEEAEKHIDVFATGFPIIDRSLQGGGLKRGEIGAWIALSGRGKSLALVRASVVNIVKGKKVLYISTEMDQDRIAARFDSGFSLIGQHELMPRKEEVFAALKDEVKGYEDSKRLIIKQFPSGSADFSTVRAFYAQCVAYGFRPDLVVVDYPGDMKHSEQIPLHTSMRNMLMMLRGFGAEEKHCTLVAIQPNRGASNLLNPEEFIDESKIGGSYDQFQVLDAFWSLNQTDSEKTASVGRAKVHKARNGKSNFSFKVSYGYPSQTLVLEEISHDEYTRRMNQVRDFSSDNLGITEVQIDKTPKSIFAPSDGERVS